MLQSHNFLTNCRKRKLVIAIRIRFKQKPLLMFMLVTTILVILKYSSYLTFLVSRGWYDWVTLNSKSDSIEVNVVDINIVKDMDVEKINENISKAYLGYVDIYRVYLDNV